MFSSCISWERIQFELVAVATNASIDPLFFWTGVMLLLIAAAFVKGVVGIGLPTMVIAVMSQFVDPRIAITLLLMPTFFSNSYQAIRGERLLFNLKSYWTIIIPLMIFIALMSFFSAQLPVSVMLIAVGIVIILFVLSSFIRRHEQKYQRRDRFIQFGVGVFSGSLGGLTSLSGPPMVMYLIFRGVQKDEFVAAIGLLLTCASLPLIFGYWAAGLTTPSLLLLSALLIFPTFIGYRVGEYARSLLNPEIFRMALLSVFFVLGLNLLRRGLAL